MKRLVHFLILNLLFGLSCAMAQPVVQVDGDVPLFALKGRMGVFSDQSRRLSISDIQKAQRNNQFETDSSQFVNFGMGQADHWLYFALSKSLEVGRDLVVTIPDTYVDDVQLYIFKKDSLVVYFQTKGWKTPLPDRPIAQFQHSFPVHLNSKGLYDCYLKLHRSEGTLKGTVFISTKRDYYNMIAIVNQISSFIQGALLLLSVFGLSLFVIARERLYFWYFFQALALCLFIMGRQGVTNFFFLGTSQVLSGAHSVFAFTTLQSIGHLMFVYYYLPLDKIAPRNTRYFILGLSAWFFLLFLSSFSDIANILKFKTLYASSAISALFLVWVIINGLRRNDSKTKLYALAEIPFLGIVIYYILGIFFDISTTLISQQGLQFAPLFEVVVLAVGISIRFTDFQRHNNILLDDLNKIQHKIIQVQESERLRIAQDLHDDVGNTLAAAKGLINSVKDRIWVKAELPEIDKAHLLIDKAGVDLRAITHDLMPVDFTKYKLTDVVKQISAQAEQASGIKFEFSVIGVARKLNPERELILYRICKELISNILKHSGASRSFIQLMYQDDVLILFVEDNGVGILSEQLEKDHSGVGLKNVSSRAAYIEGNLIIDKHANGMTIILEVPYGSNQYSKDKNPDR
jgi:signal transduction histidine kinase